MQDRKPSTWPYRSPPETVAERHRRQSREQLGEQLRGSRPAPRRRSGRRERGSRNNPYIIRGESEEGEERDAAMTDAPRALSEWNAERERCAAMGVPETLLQPAGVPHHLGGTMTGEMTRADAGPTRTQQVMESFRQEQGAGYMLQAEDAHWTAFFDSLFARCTDTDFTPVALANMFNRLRAVYPNSGLEYQMAVFHQHMDDLVAQFANAGGQTQRAGRDVGAGQVGARGMQQQALPPPPSPPPPLYDMRVPGAGMGGAGHALQQMAPYATPNQQTGVPGLHVNTVVGAPGGMTVPSHGAMHGQQSPPVPGTLRLPEAQLRMMRQQHAQRQANADERARYERGERPHTGSEGQMFHDRDGDWRGLQGGSRHQMREQEDMQRRQEA